VHGQPQCGWAREKPEVSNMNSLVIQEIVNAINELEKRQSKLVVDRNFAVIEHDQKTFDDVNPQLHETEKRLDELRALERQILESLRISI
jgi:hypothetical protein